MLSQSLRWLLYSYSLLNEKVDRAIQTSSYVRHSPPSLYATAETTLCGEFNNDDARTSGVLPAQRFTTKLLDCATTIIPRQTCGVYILQSTHIDDIEFTNGNEISCTMLGLPTTFNESEAQKFIASNFSSLKNLSLIVLPELNPYCGSVLKIFMETFPEITIACNAFTLGFLSNPSFFHHVRNNIITNNTNNMHNDNELNCHITFPSIDSARIKEIDDNTTLEIGAKSNAKHRELCVYNVYPKSSEQSTKLSNYQNNLELTHKEIKAMSEYEDWERSKNVFSASKLNEESLYYHYTPVFLYDNIFRSLHVGSTLWQLPWVSHVISETAKDSILPMPHVLTKVNSQNKNISLLQNWRVESATASIIHALHRTRHVERVLSNCYGELRGDVEDVCIKLEKNASQLAQLRDRLSTRLATDVLREMSKWNPLMLKKIVKEVLCTQKEVNNTTEEVIKTFYEWLEHNTNVSLLSASLTYDAIANEPKQSVSTLQQEKPRQVTEKYKKVNHQRNNCEAKASSQTNVTYSSVKDVCNGEECSKSEHLSNISMQRMRGNNGKSLLQQIFEKMELKSYCKLLQDEDIDVETFLSMSSEELRTVFKATFGIVKKLQSIQNEIKKEIGQEFLQPML